MTGPPLLLRLLAHLVPASRREDWVQEWYGEIAFARTLDGRHRRNTLSSYLRLLGACEDAIWLRWRNGGRSMLVHDIRYSLRGLFRQLGFTTVVTLTLALGIGANTAIFTLVDAVLLRPLPVQAPTELVDIYTSCRRGFAYCTSSYPDFVDYRETNRVFSDVAAFAGVDVPVGEGQNPRLASGVLVTGSYFSLLGVPAQIGRTIMPNDDELGAPQLVAVLSHLYWQRQFGGDPTVIGRELRLSGAPYTIIGVGPSGFRGTRLDQSPDFWIPFSSQPEVATGPLADRDRFSQRGMRWIQGVIGRKRSGTSLELARADMLRVSDQMQEEFPAARGGRTVTVEAVRSYTLPVQAGGDIVQFVSLLLAVVGLALLIACANIANLLLARATARRREIAVRMALGAGRGRLIKQLLTESLLLASLGAVAGLGVAAISLRFLSVFALPGFVSIDILDLHLNLRVLAFTGSIALLTGLLFGLVPAWQTARQGLSGVLQERSSQGSTAGMLRLRSVLLALQTAMALTLLVGAGLFVRSLQNGLQTDVGFETRNLAIGNFDLGMHQYDVPRATAFIDALEERTSQLPGVRHVTTSVLPPLAQNGSGTFVLLDDYDAVEGEELRVEMNWVGANYMKTMGIPLLSGRDIATSDRAGAPLAAIINATMAQRWFPNIDPVGRIFRMGSPDLPDIQIVGVAGDVKYGLTQDPEPFVYLPISQYPERALVMGYNVLVSSDAPAMQLLPAMRAAIRELDPNVIVQDLETLDNRFGEYLMPQRMGSTLLSALGGLTVLLAVVGITGVVTYAVNQRRHEIGIRLALGATSRHVVMTMIRGALWPIGIGLGIGVIASATTTHFLSNFMYGISTTDPLTFVAVSLLMGAVGAIAAYVPARRAIGISPTQTLRGD